MARYIEDELKKEKKINYYTTNIGKGNPRIYYNVIPENEKPENEIPRIRMRAKERFGHLIKKDR